MGAPGPSAPFGTELHNNRRGLPFTWCVKAQDTHSFETIDSGLLFYQLWPTMLHILYMVIWQSIHSPADLFKLWYIPKHPSCCLIKSQAGGMETPKKLKCKIMILILWFATSLLGARFISLSCSLLYMQTNVCCFCINCQNTWKRSLLLVFCPSFLPILHLVLTSMSLPIELYRATKLFLNCSHFSVTGQTCDSQVHTIFGLFVMGKQVWKV